jgi:hypothetical protein
LVDSPDPAPVGPGQLGGDPSGPKARVAEREGDHPLLDQRAGYLGHARWPPPELAGHGEVIRYG